MNFLNRRYRLGDCKLSVVCYADDGDIIANSENDHSVPLIKYLNSTLMEFKFASVNTTSYCEFKK